MDRLCHQGLNGISAAQGIFALFSNQPEVVEPAHPLAPDPDALYHTIRESDLRLRRWPAAGAARV